MLSQVFMVVALSVFAGCRNHDRRDDCSNPIRINSVAASATRMNASRLKKLQDGVRFIRLGDDEGKVKLAIGDPDDEYIYGPKESPHAREKEYRACVYYVSLVNQTPGNSRDKIVTLSFDHKGRLFSITSNVDGIPNLCCEADGLRVR